MAPVPFHEDIAEDLVVADVLHAEVVLVVVHERGQVSRAYCAQHRVVDRALADRVDHMAREA